MRALGLDAGVSNRHHKRSNDGLDARLRLGHRESVAELRGSKKLMLSSLSSWPIY